MPSMTDGGVTSNSEAGCGSLGVHFLGVCADAEQVGHGHFACRDYRHPKRGHAHGRQRSAQRYLEKYLGCGTIQKGLFFQFRLDQSETDAHNAHNPRQGRHAVNPDRASPARQPGRCICSQREPALIAKTRLPRPGLQIQAAQRSSRPKAPRKTFVRANRSAKAARPAEFPKAR